MTAEFDPITTIDALLDGAITPQQHATLDAWLAADPANAAVLVARTRLHRNLHASLAVGMTATETTPDRRNLRETETSQRTSRVFPLAVAIAAALMLTTAAVAIYMFTAAHDSEPVGFGSSPAVATLIDVLGGATVLVDNDIANPGDELPARTVSIESGGADFLLTNRVGIRLIGRSTLTVHDTMHATLTRGRASFDCPPEAHGYAVAIPGGGRVVDLGTRFDVVVDEHADRTRLHVVEGSVRLELPDGRTQTLAAHDHWVVYSGGVAEPWVESPEVARWRAHVESLEQDGSVIANLPLATDAAIDGNRLVESNVSNVTVTGAILDDGRFPDDRSLRFHGAESADRATLTPTHRAAASDGSHTVAIWFRVDRFETAYQALAVSSDKAWRITRHQDTDTLSFNTTGDKGDNNLAATTAVDDGRWHLIVAVYDAAEATKRIYIDGRREAHANVRLEPQTPAPVTIGDNDWIDGKTFNGWIDDVLILRRPMNEQEIERLYEAARPAE